MSDNIAAPANPEIPAVSEPTALTSLKSSGQLLSPYNNLIVVVNYNDPRFIGQKETLSEVDLGKGNTNMYSPFKKTKDGQVGAFLRDALTDSINTLNHINTSKLLVLGAAKGASSSASLTKLLVAVGEGFREHLGSKADDTVLFSSGDNSTVLSDYLKVGNWSTPITSDVIGAREQQGYLVVSVQLPELYDSDTKYSVLQKAVKFLENFVSKHQPDTNVLVAVSMSSEFHGDTNVRDFADELHDNFIFFSRKDLNGDEAWMPKTKKDQELLMPATSDMLWVTSIGEAEAAAE
jgi:hypothetical protein